LLGGIRLDEGKTKLERQGAALIALPVAVAMDAVAFTLCVIAVGAGGGGSGGEFETPRFMWRIPKLVRNLTHPDANERQAAIEALKRYGAFAKVAVPRLRLLLTDPDPDNRLSASTLLTELCPNDPTWALTSMVDLLGSPDVNVRRRAALRISRECGAETPEARLGACINALNDPDPHVRANIAATLGRMGTAALPAVDGLRRLLRDPSWRVRRNATYALRRIEQAQRFGG
jgi:HEAT repeat protein